MSHFPEIIGDLVANPDQFTYSDERIGMPQRVSSANLTYIIFPYSCLFLIGFAGNVSVLTYVFYVTRSLKWSVMALGNTLVYIMVLSVVDLLVILSIPFLITQQLLQYWMFGNAICKLYWVLEIASKICSTLILCALAFDRYMAICHPEIKRVHSVQQTAAIAFFACIFSLVLIMPIVVSATVAVRNLSRSVRLKSRNLHRIAKNTCNDGLEISHRPVLMALLALVAFLLPTIAIVFFYVKIMLRLRRQMSAHIQSRIPYRRITLYTCLITSFFLLCHIPFWTTQIVGVVAAVMGWDSFSVGSNLRFIIMHGSHMLPFVSATFNWLIYALLNSQFKKGFVLVTERMLRKQTRSMLPTSRDLCDGGMTLDVASRCDDVVALCPNCEHPLTIRMKAPHSQYSK
ncbi:hypothetical protein PENTCL1PPCAC_2026 [Pristionchus entomophagus]|uniref:G-protein coupled receptors family 1 profile domain-containing protein n=1 Tax=Pristionchus entomophagus TaxID=358040 RepID=A0AAV5SJM5_9BILA|nr:hypothetical protein PENTCL1PPCAC_2026 [Pristionchus entomophagus]